MKAVPTFKIVSVPRLIFEAVVLALTAVLHARAFCVVRVKRKMQLLERVVLARKVRASGYCNMLIFYLDGRRSHSFLFSLFFF